MSHRMSNKLAVSCTISIIYSTYESHNILCIQLLNGTHSVSLSDFSEIPVGFGRVDGGDSNSVRARD